MNNFETEVIRDQEKICWYIKNTWILHREDGPAVLYKDGGYEYRINGVLHRQGEAAQLKYLENKYMLMPTRIYSYYHLGMLWKTVSMLWKTASMQESYTYETWFNYGKEFLNKEEWYNSLSKEDKINMAWEL